MTTSVASRAQVEMKTRLQKLQARGWELSAKPGGRFRWTFGTILRWTLDLFGWKKERERERERADGHEKAQEDTTYIESMTGAERSKTFLGKPGGKKGPLEGEE